MNESRWQTKENIIYLANWQKFTNTWITHNGLSIARKEREWIEKVKKSITQAGRIPNTHNIFFVSSVEFVVDDKTNITKAKRSGMRKYMICLFGGIRSGCILSKRRQMKYDCQMLKNKSKGNGKKEFELIFQFKWGWLIDG